jgi:hypothetical protein
LRLRLEPRILQDVHPERDIRTRLKRLTHGHVKFREVGAIELGEPKVDVPTRRDATLGIGNCILGVAKGGCGSIIIVHGPPPPAGFDRDNRKCRPWRNVRRATGNDEPKRLRRGDTGSGKQQHRHKTHLLHDAARIGVYGPSKIMSRST